MLNHWFIRVTVRRRKLLVLSFWIFDPDDEADTEQEERDPFFCFRKRASVHGAWDAPRKGSVSMGERRRRISIF